VAGLLTDALQMLLRHQVRLVVAGRTDAGVHALGQVAHVDVPPSSLSPLAPPSSIMHLRATPTAGGCAYLHHHEGSGGLERLARSLNGVLPADIRIGSVRPAPDGFDARFSALARRYSYRVADGWLDPLRRRDTLAHPRPLNVDAMNTAAAALLGEHDFAAFCRRREGASTVRGLLAFEWARDESGVAVATVEADAFCHSMVRALVGALLAVGEGRRDAGWPSSVLEKGVRDSAVQVVAAHGLTLEEVRYPHDEMLAGRAIQTRRRRG
jgi:tRNA pseudouridine38-40 synthase